MIKILFLHGLESHSCGDKEKLLQTIFGEENVKAPNLKTRQTATLFTLSIILLLAIFLGLAIYEFIEVSRIIAGIIFALTILFISIIYLVGGRGATHIMLKRSKIIAEKAFKSFRPNVIVAYSFGAVTALQMDVPKCSMLLLAPAQDQFTKYMKIDKPMSIREYPYVLVVHGCNDTRTPIDDSIRLIETSSVGKCRLEVIEDDDRLISVSPDDMRNWIEEAYERGMQEVVIMVQEGNKHVDPSLYEKEAE